MTGFLLFAPAFHEELIYLVNIAQLTNNENEGSTQKLLHIQIMTNINVVG